MIYITGSKRLLALKIICNEGAPLDAGLKIWTHGWPWLF